MGLNSETLDFLSVVPPGNCPKSSSLKLPTDVKFDSGGNLLVMDTGNERIAIFREDGSIVASVLEGWFKFCGGTFCNLCYNHITGAIAASNDDAHCVTLMSPIFLVDR